MLPRRKLQNMCTLELCMLEINKDHHQGKGHMYCVTRFFQDQW